MSSTSSSTASRPRRPLVVIVLFCKFLPSFLPLRPLHSCIPSFTSLLSLLTSFLFDLPRCSREIAFSPWIPLVLFCLPSRCSFLTTVFLVFCFSVRLGKGCPGCGSRFSLLNPCLVYPLACLSQDRLTFPILSLLSGPEFRSGSTST